MSEIGLQIDHIENGFIAKHLFALIDDNLTCENSHFASLLAAKDVLVGETSATQGPKFHTDDVNHCLHN